MFWGQGMSTSSVSKLFSDNAAVFFYAPGEVILDRDPRFTVSFW